MLLFVLVLMLIQAVLFLFKVVGAISWSWEAVFFPFWATAMFVFLALLVMLFLWLMILIAGALLVLIV